MLVWIRGPKKVYPTGFKSGLHVFFSAESGTLKKDLVFLQIMSSCLRIISEIFFLFHIQGKTHTNRKGNIKTCSFLFTGQLINFRFRCLNSMMILQTLKISLVLSSIEVPLGQQLRDWGRFGRRRLALPPCADASSDPMRRRALWAEAYMLMFSTMWPSWQVDIGGWKILNYDYSLCSRQCKQLIFETIQNRVLLNHCLTLAISLYMSWCHLLLSYYQRQYFSYGGWHAGSLLKEDLYCSHLFLNS